MHDALADRSQVAYDPYTPEQQQGIRRQLEKFVAAQVREGASEGGKKTDVVSFVKNVFFFTRTVPAALHVWQGGAGSFSDDLIIARCCLSLLMHWLFSYLGGIRAPGSA